MKGSYEKPVTFLDVIQYQTHLLQASPVTGQFTDKEPDNGWDAGGANSNENQLDNSLWDEE